MMGMLIEEYNNIMSEADADIKTLSKTYPNISETECFKEKDREIGEFLERLNNR